jgi:hypothetical protein
MAECKLLTEGREALAIGRAANRFAGLARNDRDTCYQVVVEVASRAEDETDDHSFGGSRRSHAEGYRNPSMPNRKRCAVGRDNARGVPRTRHYSTPSDLGTSVGNQRNQVKARKVTDKTGKPLNQQRIISFWAAGVRRYAIED